MAPTPLFTHPFLSSTARMLTNATAGAVMNIQNVTITAPATGFSLCDKQRELVVRDLLQRCGSGSVTNVTIDHIFQFQNIGCNPTTGIGYPGRRDSARTVTITNTTVTDYQRNGFERTRVDDHERLRQHRGHPHPLSGLIAQNGVSHDWGPPAGSVTDNTIFGSGDSQCPPGPHGNRHRLCCCPGAHDVTLTTTRLTGLDRTRGDR